MRYLLTILFLFDLAFGQTINWTTGSEASVSQYVIEKSVDSLSWKPYQIITPGQTSYSVSIPDSQSYWRVHAEGDSNFFTKALLYTDYSVNQLINSSLQPSKNYVTVNWTSVNENLSSYEIDQSTDGKTFSLVTTIPAKGNSSYSVQVNRPTITTSVCSFKFFGFCFSHKNVTTVNNAKEIIEIIAIKDGTRTLLTTVYE